MRDKYCDACGYPTHKLYPLPSWGWDEGVCADCLIEELANADEGELEDKLNEALNGG